MQDGATKLFLSTKGTANDIPKPLKIFLNYIDGQKPDDELTVEMDNAVKTAKNRDEWRRAYMTLYLEMEREKEEARKEAMEETILNSVKNLMANTSWSALKSMEALNVPASEQAKYLARL